MDHTAYRGAPWSSKVKPLPDGPACAGRDAVLMCRAVWGGKQRALPVKTFSFTRKLLLLGCGGAESKQPGRSVLSLVFNMPFGNEEPLGMKEE